MPASSKIAVSRIPVDLILPLRHRVLRQGLPFDEAKFLGDNEPTAAHFAVIGSDQAVVGCVTLIQRDWKDRPAWQLRGMAVDDLLQKTGVGAAMLAEVDRFVAASPYSKQLWCNARIKAKGFYERHGWKIESELFEIPTAGPHYVMSKRL